VMMCCPRRVASCFLWHSLTSALRLRPRRASVALKTLLVGARKVHVRLSLSVPAMPADQFNVDTQPKATITGRRWSQVTQCMPCLMSWFAEHSIF
jgi:hypothetical protein